MKEYKVLLNFGTYTGTDKEYVVYADSEEEAIEAAKEEARDDLYVEDLNQVDDDEWEASVSFAGFIGADSEYTVYADTEEEAWDIAIDEALYDLDGEIISVDESKAELIASLLDRDEISYAQMQAIEDDWKKFYNHPERFEDTPIIDMINQYLDEMEAEA